MSIGTNLFEADAQKSDISSMDIEDLNRLLAANLQSLMDEKGLNPSAWAKDAGLNHTAVRDILLTKVKSPTYRTLLSLADTAGVDVRRITIGPDFKSMDQEDAELLDLLSQLEPLEREFLIDAAKARIASRADSE